MESAISDAALFYKKLGEELIGTCATYVDDSLHAGNEKYQEITKITEEKFKCKNREYDDLQFSGLEIETKNNEFCAHQKRYISKLKRIPETANFSEFRSTRAKLACISNSRPDISCPVAKLTQVTEEKYEKNQKSYIIKINDILNHLEEYKDLVLK